MESAPLIKLHTVQAAVSVRVLRYGLRSVRCEGGQIALQMEDGRWKMEEQLVDDEPISTTQEAVSLLSPGTRSSNNVSTVVRVSGTDVALRRWGPAKALRSTHQGSRCTIRFSTCTSTAAIAWGVGDGFEWEPR